MKIEKHWVRRGLAVMAFMFCWSFATKSAWAGTYLQAAALLLDEARKSSDWINAHFGDVELAEVAHQLSEARVKAGRTLTVSKEVERAHPHFLLTLETSERAMAAAVDREGTRFLRLLGQARDEERTFRAILSQQRLTLPEIDHSSK
jgi:recombinational DNA repair ATPase RecF